MRKAGKNEFCWKAEFNNPFIVFEKLIISSKSYGTLAFVMV